MKVITKSLKAFAMISALIASQAYASVVISGTRVIFPGNEREVTIKLTNDGNTPALVQTWIDKGEQDASPDTIDVPFTLLPAMFRMEPQKGQTLRMIYSNASLPADKESLFWLNVLEIPPKVADGADRNQLQVAFRSRIKIMFRPEGLPGSAQTAPAQVGWQVARGANGKYVLKATNPTPYVVNVGSVLLHSGGKKFDAGAGYVLPGATHEFPITELNAPPAADAKVQFGSINDWGASTNNERPVSIQP
ncbi:pilus assembly protein [Burkholderia sp. SRS-46]|nr:pilus assembly protein [Burkholderia sp. SRS-46]